jgi:hypothetical protein
MTKEEMIELAKQSGWEYAHGESGFEPLWAFAKLVAEKEREACWDIVGIALLGSDRELTKRVATAIRARGEA